MEEDIVEIPEFPRKFTEVLYSYQQERHLCDCLIITNNGCIPAHRLVLVMTSPYFNYVESKRNISECQQGDNNNFTVAFQNADVLTIVRLLYTGKLFVSKNNILRLAEICSFLQLKEALTICLKYMKDNCHGNLNWKSLQMDNSMNTGSIHVDLDAIFLEKSCASETGSALRIGQGKPQPQKSAEHRMVEIFSKYVEKKKRMNSIGTSSVDMVDDVSSECLMVNGILLTMEENGELTMKGNRELATKTATTERNTPKSVRRNEIRYDNRTDENDFPRLRRIGRGEERSSRRTGHSVMNTREEDNVTGAPTLQNSLMEVCENQSICTGISVQPSHGKLDYMREEDNVTGASTLQNSLMEVCENQTIYNGISVQPSHGKLDHTVDGSITDLLNSEKDDAFREIHKPAQLENSQNSQSCEKVVNITDQHVDDSALGLPEHCLSSSDVTQGQLNSNSKQAEVPKETVIFKDGNDDTESGRDDEICDVDSDTCKEAIGSDDRESTGDTHLLNDENSHGGYSSDATILSETGERVEEALGDDFTKIRNSEDTGGKAGCCDDASCNKISQDGYSSDATILSESTVLSDAESSGDEWKPGGSTSDDSLAGGNAKKRKRLLSEVCKITDDKRTRMDTGSRDFENFMNPGIHVHMKSCSKATSLSEISNETQLITCSKGIETAESACSRETSHLSQGENLSEIENANQNSNSVENSPQNQSTNASKNSQEKENTTAIENLFEHDESQSTINSSENSCKSQNPDSQQTQSTKSCENSPSSNTVQQDENTRTTSEISAVTETQSNNDTENSNDKTEKVTYSCYQCKEEFEDPHQLIAHRKTMHPVSCRDKFKRCNMCPFKTMTKKFLMEHKFKKHNAPVDENKYKLLRCHYENCGYTTIVECRLSDHIRTHHEDNGERNICEICGKSFRRKCHLNRHVKSHENFEDRIAFTCSICGKGFNTRAHLECHINSVHLKKPGNILCHLCPYSTKGKKFLASHLLRVHDKVYAADTIRYDFPECVSLLAKPNGNFSVKCHAFTDPGAEKKYKCSICGAAFALEGYLQSHFKRHNSEVIYCKHEGCSYLTNSKHGYKEHLKTMHTNRDYKPYKCHLCDHSCKLKGNLTKHLKKKHKVNVTNWIEKRRQALDAGKGFSDYLKEYSIKNNESRIRNAHLNDSESD
ncbi:hypothetical protein FSP39_021453 [Pinctada imbricata]|uniref:Uncharacterized protein n=1 Tax=Pinctada imbricata TaxID=66713 RepID=A0AA89BXU3_PINIB|nr:hypothetical protein FSP39_021453 [Pinctada imbricata]